MEIEELEERTSSFIMSKKVRECCLKTGWFCKSMLIERSKNNKYEFYLQGNWKKNFIFIFIYFTRLPNSEIIETGF